jgi:Nif-specific regulatory protein
MTQMLMIPQVVLPPRYQLLSVLRESPSICVYRVFDQADRRDEAIKILRYEFTQPEELLQFKTEFRTLARLDHENIIKVHDFGLLDGRLPYFTMDFFPGRRVNDYFDGQNWEALYHVILQIASGLHHVHSHGVLHLDLKPSNLLVDEQGRVKIMDFGVAAEQHKLLDRKIRGTLHYMAPEVLRQDQIDVRADLYGLGMTLYETVTGALPTFGMPPIEVIRFHLNEELRRPSAINPQVPDRLEKIMIRLLEKDPRHRYPSAAALLHDVAEAAGLSEPSSGLLVGRGETLVAPLIGRERELEALNAAIDGARGQRGGGLVVSGPEGIGKSRMVREVTLRAQLEGARVFWGRCPVNRKSIYAPFYEIFQQLVAAVNPEADPIEEIRRILKPIAPGAQNGRDARGNKFRLFNRVAQSIQDFYGFLNVIGNSGSPLIMVIEDLQWADTSTVELLSFLVGEARHSNLLIIGLLTADRDADLPMEDASGRSSVTAWEQRCRESGMSMIELGPLPEGAVRECVEAILGDEQLPSDFVRWILWESGGFPIQISRAIDYLVAHEYLRWSHGGWIAEMERIQNLRIPGGAAALWNENLDRLSEEHRRFIQSASVLGEHFDLTVLARIASIDEEDAYESARELSLQGLLDVIVDGRTYAFPQISLRETIYGTMAARLRADLHQCAAEAHEDAYLAGAVELIGQVAYHYARGNDHRKGIDYCIAAGRQAIEALAYEQAGEFFRIALELMDLTGEEGRKTEIREKLGDAYYRANNLRGAMQVYQFLLRSVQGRDDVVATLDSARIMKKIAKVLSKRGEFEPALSYFENALQMFQRSGEPLEVAELLNRMALIQKERGNLDEAERAVTSALEVINELPVTPIHGYVTHTLGLIAYAGGQWQSACESFEAAVRISAETGSPQLRKVATGSLGNVLWKLGRWDEALGFFRQNLEQSELEGDLWDLVHAYNNVALIEFSRGNFHAAANLFDKSVRIDEKLGSPENEAVAEENLGEALEMIGRWSEARERFERCLKIEGFDESRSSRVSVYVPLARLTSKTGDIPKALELALKAYEAARRNRNDELAAEAAVVLAQIEADRENFADADHYIAEAVSFFEASGTSHGLARALAVSADLLLRQQKLEEARETIGLARELAQQLGDRFTCAVSAWTLGKVLFMQGERQAADDLFAEAEAVFDQLDTPYETGRLFFDIGVIKEDPDEAALALRRAIKTFERLEAVHDLDRARGALFRIRPGGKRPESSVIGLYEIVKIINSTLSVEEVLNRVLDLALRRLRAERGMIILLDPITSALHTRVVRNIREGGESESRRSPQSIIKEVIQSGSSIISADARVDERFIDSDSVISENIVSTLCVPLVIRDKISGAIYVDHRETRHLFSQRDLSFLEAFADQAAIAIQNARLYEEIEESKARLAVENETLRREVLVEKHLDSVVGHSKAVARIQFAVRKAASSNSTVLIRGESGTGKGLVARIVHNIGSRRNGAFINFNCAALPETLAESELFGHEKGAFTGADRRKLGRFELANGGTIFLDEIGKVGLSVQAKLLRVVEEKEFERVGGTQTLKADVKIIAATNLDLERAIEEGTFREDLFYRLNIIPLFLPPLRERKEDIPLLSEHFIRKICRDLGIEPKRLEHGILDLFETYHWPGNVRELEATLHRAIVMSSDDILTRADFFSLIRTTTDDTAATTVAGVPAEILNPSLRRIPISGDIYEDVIARVDRQLIVQALEESGGKIRETARRLGLARNTLKAKMQKYQIAGRE